VKFDVTAFLQRIQFSWNVTRHLGEWVITFQMFIVPSGSGCLILLGLILANGQLDALFHVFVYFISLHVSSMRVLIIRRSNWYAGQKGTEFPPDRHNSHLHRLIIPDDILIQFDLLMMSAVMLETCREMK
jgi:hypothetical protein